MSSLGSSFFAKVTCSGSSSSATDEPAGTGDAADDEGAAAADGVAADAGLEEALVEPGGGGDFEGGCALPSRGVGVAGGWEAEGSVGFGDPS